MSLNEFSKLAEAYLKLFDALALINRSSIYEAMEQIYIIIIERFPGWNFGDYPACKFGKLLKEKGIVETWHLLLDSMRENSL